MSLRTFPKTLYARIDKSDKDDPLLLAYESPDEATEDGVVTPVGVYKLVRTDRYKRVIELVKEG